MWLPSLSTSGRLSTALHTNNEKWIWMVSNGWLIESAVHEWTLFVFWSKSHILILCCRWKSNFNFVLLVNCKCQRSTRTTTAPLWQEMDYPRGKCNNSVLLWNDIFHTSGSPILGSAPISIFNEVLLTNLLIDFLLLCTLYFYLVMQLKHLLETWNGKENEGFWTVWNAAAVEGKWISKMQGVWGVSPLFIYHLLTIQRCGASLMCRTFVSQLLSLLVDNLGHWKVVVTPPCTDCDGMPLLLLADGMSRVFIFNENWGNFIVVVCRNC